MPTDNSYSLPLLSSAKYTKKTLQTLTICGGLGCNSLSIARPKVVSPSTNGPWAEEGAPSSQSHSFGT
jgi:hypothetical protein